MNNKSIQKAHDDFMINIIIKGFILLFFILIGKLVYHLSLSFLLLMKVIG